MPVVESNKALLGIALVALLAGCISADDPGPSPAAETPESPVASDGRTSTTPTPPAPNQPSGWENGSRIMLFERETTESTAYGSCLLPPVGAYPEIELPREEEPGRVVAGTDHISVVVTAPVGAMGVEFGYAVDKNEKTWFEPVFASDVQDPKEFKIDVAAEQTEPSAGEIRWRFFWRTGYPAETGQCYSGPTLAGPGFLIEAVKE